MPNPNRVRLLRSGDIEPTGRVVSYSGQPMLRLRSGETVNVLFDWADYFTRTDEPVTVTATTGNATATLTDSTDSTMASISIGDNKTADMTVKVAVTTGETFTIPLRVESALSEAKDYGCA